MLNAASNLILASYRNQLTHVFVRIAIVALAVNGCTGQETITIGEFSFAQIIIALKILIIIIIISTLQQPYNVSVLCYSETFSLPGTIQMSSHSSFDFNFLSFESPGSLLPRVQKS